MTPLTEGQIRQFTSRIPGVVENELMSKHTNFRIGGPARLYVTANSSDEIVQAVETARDLDIPCFVFGGGSNVLVADAGCAGAVIQAANRRLVIQGTQVRVESGAITALIARKTVEAGLTGFEWAIGVPGTIGGAVYGNAGCFGGEMQDVLQTVDAYRLKDRQRISLSRKECHFGYRESMFKHEPHVILGCALQLVPSKDQAASRARLEEIMRLRKEKQPLDQSSAGCVFKNYEFLDEKELEILRRSIDEVPDSMLQAKRLSAGWLIDQVGMTGKRIGNVEISSKHGNFFVNKGGARAQDVLALISMTKMKIRDEFGIELQEEVQYLGI
jgi:UDP-N-acetylmuramate dehydrogenase